MPIAGLRARARTASQIVASPESGEGAWLGIALGVALGIALGVALGIALGVARALAFI